MKFLILLTTSFLIINVNFGQTAEDYFQQGNEYSDSKNNSMAIVSYTLAITKNPYEWNYYQRRSWIYFETKAFEKALEDINVALDLKPKYENFLCLNIRAKIYLELRDYKNAISDLTYIIDVFKNELEVRYGYSYLERGKAFLYSGDKENACNNFQECLKKGRWSEAESFLDKFCK